MNRKILTSMDTFTLELVQALGYAPSSDSVVGITIDIQAGEVVAVSVKKYLREPDGQTLVDQFKRDDLAIMSKAEHERLKSVEALYAQAQVRDTP